MRAMALLTLLLTVTACGDAAGGLVSDLQDHPDPLTDQPGDLLFTLELIEAEESYDPITLTLAIKRAGGTLLSTEFDLLDSDGDGKLGVGDTLVGREGPVETYGPADSGTQFEVSLSMRVDGEQNLQELARAFWVGDGGLGAGER